MGLDKEPYYINIWDDFSDTDFIPHTYAYIEDDETPKEEQKQVLKNFTLYLNMVIDTGDTFVHLHECKIMDRWEVWFSNITHEKLELWIPYLEDNKLIVNGRRVKIYSES